MNKPKKILIIKTAAMGDVLMATPMLRAIRKSYPDSEISWLVGEWSSQVLRNNPYLNHIIEFDDQILFKKKLIEIVKLFKGLRKHDFDISINLHRSGFMALLASLAGAKVKAGFKRDVLSGLVNDVAVNVSEKHETLEYLDIADALGVPADGLKLDIFPSSDDMEKARTLLMQSNDNELKIGIAPGGAKNPGENMSCRRWPISNYVLLCKELRHKRNARIVLLGGKGDKAITDTLIDAIDIPFIDLTGRTSILEAAAVLGYLDLLICNDAGLMHVAGAMKTSVIAIFGPTDPTEKIPFNDSAKYLWAKSDCSPCYKDGSYPDCKINKCMEAISPSYVLRSVEETIKSPKELA